MTLTSTLKILSMRNSYYFINRHSSLVTVSLALLTTIVCNGSVRAAPPVNLPVDAGLLQQQLAPNRNRPPSPPAEIKPLPKTDESHATTHDTKNEALFLIKRFRLNQVLQAINETQLNTLLAEFLNKENTAEDLKKAADMVTADLQAKGYVFARVSIKQDEKEENTAIVYIALGKLSGLATGKPEVFVQAPQGKRLKDEVAKNIIKSAAKDIDGVKLKEIERGLLLINDLPGITATGTFVRGQEIGSTALKINLVEKSLWRFSAGTDNSGSRYTGAQRLLGGIVLNDPSGYGDLAQLDLIATQGTQTAVASYRVPISYSGLTLNLSGNYLHYKVVTGLEDADAHGNASNLNVGLSYPLLRSQTTNFYIGGQVSDKRLSDSLGDTRINDRRIRSFNLNWLGNLWASKRDGVAYAGIVTLGDLNRDGVPSDATQDQSTRQSQGRYVLLRHLAKWEHAFNPSWSLVANHVFQLSNKNLDTSEKLYLGGPRGVRAYPVEEAGSDQGQILNLEARWRLPYASKAGESWTLLAFYDFGQTQLNHSTWTGWNASTPTLPNSYHLQSAGLGVRAQLTNRGFLEFLAAAAIGSNPGKIAGENADGLDHKYHLWVNAVLQF